MNIKEQYPRAYELIREQVLRELNKSGKLSPEIMAAVPVDSIVQNSIGAAPRMMYDILDKEGIYTNVVGGEDKWFISINRQDPVGTTYLNRRDAEVAVFTCALEMLDKK